MRRRLFLALAGFSAFPGIAFSNAADMLLSITSDSITQLRRLRAEPKFVDLPGAPAEQERKQFEPLLNALLDSLVKGVALNPSRAWVLEQMDPFVAQFYLQDSELRESCLAYLERIFGIVGIPDDAGAFQKYMIFW